MMKNGINNVGVGNVIPNPISNNQIAVLNSNLDTPNTSKIEKPSLQVKTTDLGG